MRVRSARQALMCTYCERPATTADHVPPRLLFNKPRPPLITVPACRPCNQAASLDDEYFRLALVMEEDAINHPHAKRAWETVLRSLQKPKKLRFRSAFVSSLSKTDRYSLGGIYLGKAGSYHVDYNRLSRVIERITRGLFLHHLGRRLPLGCQVRAYVSRGIDTTRPDVLRTILELIEDIRVNPLHTIGDDVFMYRYAVAKDQENSSVWIFIVYRAISFVSLTVDLTATDAPSSQSGS